MKYWLHSLFSDLPTVTLEKFAQAILILTSKLVPDLLFLVLESYCFESKGR